METNAKVYHPHAQVYVFKNVSRVTTDGGEAVSGRFMSADRIIDLAPWLSDVSGVRTSKSTREPAGGFTITLSDRIHPDDLDTLYGLLEPMDIVEIRMAHKGQIKDSNDGQLPIIMRGFISDIARPETVSQGGKPSRQVVISGQDYGKIWQILQIFYMPNYPAGENLITNFKMFSQYGVGFEAQKARDFLVAVILKVINPFIRQMMGQNEGEEADTNSDDGNPITSALDVLRVLEDDVQTGDGIVAPFGINQWNGGTIYQMLHTFLDVGPFCELFLEDREDGVFVVYRQNPFYTLSGDPIPEYLGDDGKPVYGFTDPEIAVVPAADIMSINVSRSDANVANYFWVDSPRHEMNYGPYLKLAAAQGKEESFFVQKHRNCNPKIYGIRKMWEESQQGAPKEMFNGNGLQKKKHEEQETLSGKWIGERRKQLVEQNRDNVVLEKGTIRIRGRSDIRAGMYVEVVRGDMSSMFYVYQIEHEFIPFVGYFTSLYVERGNGFAERMKRSGGIDSPYYSEIST